MNNNITFTNHNPDTVWNKLAARLQREPTHDETKAEVRRIFEKSLIERAGKGLLSHQRSTR